jgi:hypothetical protein
MVHILLLLWIFYKMFMVLNNIVEFDNVESKNLKYNIGLFYAYIFLVYYIILKLKLNYYDWEYHHIFTNYNSR